MNGHPAITHCGFLVPRHQTELGGSQIIGQVGCFTAHGIFQVDQTLGPQAAAGRNIGQKAMQPGIIQTLAAHLIQQLVGL